MNDKPFGKMTALEKLTYAVSQRKYLRLFPNEVMHIQEHIARLERGEFICKQCGIRKNAEGSGVSNEF